MRECCVVFHFDRFTRSLLLLRLLSGALHRLVGRQCKHFVQTYKVNEKVRSSALRTGLKPRNPKNVAAAKASHCVCCHSRKGGGKIHKANFCACEKRTWSASGGECCFRFSNFLRFVRSFRKSGGGWEWKKAHPHIQAASWRWFSLAGPLSVHPGGVEANNNTKKERKQALERWMFLAPERTRSARTGRKPRTSTQCNRALDNVWSGRDGQKSLLPFQLHTVQISKTVCVLATCPAIPEAFRNYGSATRPQSCQCRMQLSRIFV